MNKKHLISRICLIVIGFFIVLFLVNKQNKNENVNLNKNEVQKIHISHFMPLFDEFDVTDSNEVITIVEYLNSINKKNTKEDPRDYFGGGYGIKLYFKDGSERTLFFTGNRFLSETNRFTYEIPYREAIKFDRIVTNILKEKLSKDGKASIIGTVDSVESEQSGANISCVLKTEDNVKYNIFLRNTKIMDGTGAGNLLVHEEDKIKVFYLKGEQTDKDIIHPSMVFIEGVTYEK